MISRGSGDVPNPPNEAPKDVPRPRALCGRLGATYALKLRGAGRPGNGENYETSIPLHCSLLRDSAAHVDFAFSFGSKISGHAGV